MITPELIKRILRVQRSMAAERAPRGENWLTAVGRQSAKTTNQAHRGPDDSATRSS